MYLLIAADGQLSMQDIDNMRAFAIIEEEDGSARTSLGDIAAAAEDNHYWIDADAVIFTQTPLPVDPRHNVKIDYTALRNLITRGKL